MATKKITDLNLVGALTSGAAFEISVDGVTYRCTAQQIYDLVAQLISATGLDLTGAAALGFKAFAVTDAPEDWDHSWGGGAYDISYMNGIYFALGLDYDPVYQTLTRKEATKDLPSLAIHIGRKFPFETFGAITAVVVQGVATQHGEGNVLAGGLPDRLLWPAAGSVGGYEMIKTMTDQKTVAAAGDRDEIDGNGAAHGYDIRVHQKRSDIAGVQIWYSGRELNDSNGRPNFPDHPSARWGLRSTLDVTGSTPVTTKLEFVVQYAEPTGDPEVAPDYQDNLAFELGTGLMLLAAQIGYDNATSGMTASDTQAAIDELEARVAALEAA